jgi:hypothetical protein
MKKGSYLMPGRFACEVMLGQCVKAPYDHDSIFLTFHRVRQACAQNISYKCGLFQKILVKLKS